MCPQHDVLFDTMTVKEHLVFYAEVGHLVVTRHLFEVVTATTTYADADWCLNWSFASEIRSVPCPGVDKKSGTATVDELLSLHMSVLHQTKVHAGFVKPFALQLKGCPRERVQDEVRAMIALLKLESKRNKAASTLSGGQKRKLSVGIALINMSKVRTPADFRNEASYLKS